MKLKLDEFMKNSEEEIPIQNILPKLRSKEINDVVCFKEDIKKYIFKYKIFKKEIREEFLIDICKKNFEYSQNFIESIFSEVTNELYEIYKDEIES